MAQERDPRITKAFTAMKNIGIAAQTVKPVLKRLLKLYDRNWALIEDDNYRTLADAIFEYENDKMIQENAAIVNDGLEPPLKKLNVTPLEDQTSSSTKDNESRRLDLEEGEVPLDANEEELMDPSPSFSKYLRGQSHSLVYETSIKDRGDIHISTFQDPTGENAVTHRQLNLFCAGQAYGDPSFVLEKRERIREYHDQRNVTKPTRKEPLNCSSHVSFPASYICSGNGKKADASAPELGDSLQSTYDIASSSCGQVKISLKCNHALGQSKFQWPNLDALMKYTESKFLRSYKIIDPKFSLIHLLKELCDSYMELTSNSADRSLLNKSPGDRFHQTTGSHPQCFETHNLEKDRNKKVRSSASSNSLNLAVPQQQRVSHDRGRAFHNVYDITNGNEKISISLLDEYGNEHLPNFVYIPQNIIYQNAYVHASLARIADEDCCASCAGDCLSSSVPCACARDTGGDFAYTREGLLKEEFLGACISMNEEPHKHYHFYCPDCPLERAKNAYRPQKCKGHLVRKFVKECWRKCRCSMQCGNRVVQRGITRKLQVFLTDDGKGWGLRTLEELPKGAFVCEYVGEILTNMELYERNNQSSSKDRHTYPVLLDADWGSEGVLKDEDALCLDATYYGNVARFINHRCCDANLLDIPVEVETPDHHYYHLAFFTRRKVHAMEELTWDYGIDFDDHNHPIEAFRCRCGSAYCRDGKGKRTKPSISN
ncbi:probable inactive histone-lysine N-methyltransferase SUVR2 [Coffea arabica]|uniref:Probable inactive histone-lysine N-methyltransferase SUVR2 n=1 Tax=Coffea arabica TaxID=13443 RepID=A0A6P6UEL2_COFAR